MITNKFKILIILGTLALVITTPSIELNQVNIKPFKVIEHILGTDSLGRDILQISIKTVSLLLFITILSSLISRKLINYIHLFNLKYNNRIINNSIEISYQILNIMPVIFIFLILGAILKIEIWHLILILSLVSFPLNYKVTNNIFLQIKNDSATKFILKQKINNYKLFKKLYYYQRIQKQQDNAMQISITSLIGLETSLSFLNYSLDSNKYYTFGMYIRDNYTNLLNENAYQILIPSTILVISTYWILNYINNKV